MDIHLNQFKPRDYQLPFLKAFESKENGNYNPYGIRKYLVCWPRRSGKDICSFLLLVRAALRKIGTYYYCAPSYRSARQIIWDCITIDGVRLLDYIPKELVFSRNEQQMKIRLVNGSLIQLIGSDSYHSSLVGTNCRGIVFSEFSRADPEAYTFGRPILAANNGFVIFASTPFGKNTFFDFYTIATQNPETWFVSKLTLDDTKHIPLQELQNDRDEGLISEDNIQQEYYTSFESVGVQGSYFSYYIEQMRLKNQITNVPWQPHLQVHTAWDIGKTCTAIIYFQEVGALINIIDYYEKANGHLDDAVRDVLGKPFVYGKHFGPPDLAVKEWAGLPFTRKEKARQMGINFDIVAEVGKEDRIEHARATFCKVYIDEAKCKQLIKCLENYRQEYSEKLKSFMGQPLKDWASHAADAFCYLAVALNKIKPGTSAAELDARYKQAMYGQSSNIPSIFNNNNHQGRY